MIGKPLDDRFQDCVIAVRCGEFPADLTFVESPVGSGNYPEISEQLLNPVEVLAHFTSSF